ncbi:MAG: hypothetical protein SWH68_00765 [Thermodesulfobacteriota bacterium]|nr:hypothetical protein [Thermodesulfobacteriota bacterium]
MKEAFFTKEEVEKRKKAIFDSMSPRGQKWILKKGYEQWDPFEEPKDPIDIRKDKTQRTSQTLIREFLQSRTADKYSNQYGRGVLEMCMGIINEEDRFIGMFEFACWYKTLLEKEGIRVKE